MTEWELSDPLRPEHIEMFRRFSALPPVLNTITATPLPEGTSQRLASVRNELAPGRDPSAEIAALMPGIRLAGPLPPQPTARLLESLRYVEEGLGAAHCHRDRLRSLEEGIARICKSTMIEQGSGPETFGFRAPILGFEYHAFLFALRPALDYLAGGVAAYFKRESHSIRRLARSLVGAEPSEEVAEVQSVLAAALPNLKNILSELDDRSVRDRVAHWQIVDAGFFNLRWDGAGEVVIELVGGGEALPAFSNVDAEMAPLAAVLHKQLSVAEDLVFSIVDRLKGSTSAS